jgi:transcription-repair coupling factor (superfamily II helicase)
VQTTVSPYDEDLIIRAIQDELERGGQVFYVHNRVQTIENCADQVRSLVPFAKVAVAHGQMKERDLEQTMLGFLRKDIDVLVCSTIIESGLDIPTANTIIITEVERLGLAQIYQLRGRVGRSKEKAYAYLLFSNGARMTKDAEKRLKALMDFSHLGAGLQLAMHDLKIRGGGNILGFAQSGHITAIGYELYLKLVEQAVAELKGEPIHEIPDPEINVPIPARLPEKYIGDTDLRLNLYRRLSTIREEGQVDHLHEEVKDRFGPLPREVGNLFQLVKLRLALKRMGIVRLDVAPGGIYLNFSNTSSLDPQKFVRMALENKSIMRFVSPTRLHVRISGLSTDDGLSRVIDKLRWLEKALHG